MDQTTQERTMTKLNNTLQLVLALALAAVPMAGAQPAAIRSAVAHGDGIRVIRVAQANQNHGNANRSQGRDSLFDGTDKFAKGASEVTEINLDPSTMGLVGSSYGKEGAEARKMQSMVVHTYKYDQPGMYRMEDVDFYRRKFESGNWRCAIHVRTTSSSTDICSRADAEQVNEMVILSAEPQKLTFIHLSGKMSFDELNDMSGSASRLRPHSEFTNPAPPAKLARRPIRPATELPKSTEPPPFTPAPAAPGAPAAAAPPATK